MAPHDWGYRKVDALSEAQGHRCAYCSVVMTETGDHPSALTIDHIKPVANGGARTWENEVAACSACNNSRGATCAWNFYAWRQALLASFAPGVVLPAKGRRVASKRKRYYVRRRERTKIVADWYRAQAEDRIARWGKLAQLQEA